MARPRSALFVFTFSRNTLPPDALPVPNESFVFTQFSGQRQCFLTSEELVAELGAVGFSLDPLSHLPELNLPKPGTIYGGAPVIYEGVFRSTAG